MKCIVDLKVSERFGQVFYCKSKYTKTTKKGDAYHDIIVQDKTGVMDGKIWKCEILPNIGDFEAGDFIFASGFVDSFDNNLQLNISSVRVAEPGEYKDEDFFPVTTKDIDKLYDTLLDYIKMIRNPQMKALLEHFFVKDEEFIQQFKKHTAAESIHHGFIGGLLEHTVSVTRICNVFSSMYPEINRDLLLAAAMLHDIGKLREIAYFPLNNYTDEGQLLGHIYMGCEMVREKIKDIPDFPEKTELELCHCILAHHGELEYGSPKKPALFEAVALNHADNADAKLESFREAITSTTSNEWLPYNKVFGSGIRKTTPLEG